MKKIINALLFVILAGLSFYFIKGVVYYFINFSLDSTSSTVLIGPLYCLIMIFIVIAVYKKVKSFDKTSDYFKMRFLFVILVILILYVVVAIGEYQLRNPGLIEPRTLKNINFTFKEPVVLRQSIFTGDFVDKPEYIVNKDLVTYGKLMGAKQSSGPWGNLVGYYDTKNQGRFVIYRIGRGDLSDVYLYKQINGKLIEIFKRTMPWWELADDDYGNTFLLYPNSFPVESNIGTGDHLSEVLKYNADIGEFENVITPIDSIKVCSAASSTNCLSWAVTK